MKVTSNIVREAVNRLKSNTNDVTNDVTFLFTSDCFKNAPAIVYEQLSLVFGFYTIHGHVSNIGYQTVDYSMRNGSDVYIHIYV